MDDWLSDVYLPLTLFSQGYKQGTHVPWFLRIFLKFASIQKGPLALKLYFSTLVFQRS